MELLCIASSPVSFDIDFFILFEDIRPQILHAIIFVLINDFSFF